MPLSPPMEISLPVPLPPSTRSSSSSFLPLRSTAESPRRAAGLAGLAADGHVAVFQREVVVQGHVEVFELRDLRADVALLGFAPAASDRPGRCRFPED